MVVPVHNEVDFLRFSLPVLLGASVFEVVFVFDRCCDGSEILVQKHFASKFKAYEHLSSFNWANRCAEVKNFGAALTCGDFVLHCDADVLFDFAVLKRAYTFVSLSFLET